MLLKEFSETEPDAELREFAAMRAEDLLAARAASRQPLEDCLQALKHLSRTKHRVSVALKAFHADIRRAAADGITDPGALAELARRSGDLPIALAALAQISDVSTLQRIAVGTVCPEVALASVERIDDPAILHQITEESRFPKNVRKRALSLLDQIAGDDHPIRIAERRTRQTQLCNLVERLPDQKDQEAARDTLNQAIEEWQDLSSHQPVEPELEARWHDVVRQATEALDRARERMERERAHDAAREQAIVARRELCESLEKAEGSEIPEAIRTAQEAWDALTPSEDPRAIELAERFRSVMERGRHRHERWRARTAFQSRLTELVGRAEHLAQSTNLDAAARSQKGLERQWARIAASAEGAKWMADERDLQRRFDAAGTELQRRIEERNAERQRNQEAAQAEIVGFCERLEEAMSGEVFRSHAAERLLAGSKQAARRIGVLAEPQRQHLRQRLAAAQEALAQRIEAHTQGEDWRQWANAEAQLRLITQAEALLAAEDPRQMLLESTRLDQEWARCATAPRDQSQALWDRFRTARDALRTACRAYLSENLEKKQALCAAVEALADSTEWNTTASEIRRLQEEWKQIGAVPRKESDALFARFRAASNRFFDRRKEALDASKARWEERLSQMRTLCDTAERLAQSSDWESTAAELKTLRSEANRMWPRRNKTMEHPLRESDILGERFNSACNIFFDRYRRRDQIEQEERIAAAESLVAAVEALVPPEDKTESSAAPERLASLRELLAQWGGIGTLPAEAAALLRERMQNACDAIEADWGTAIPEEEWTSESLLAQRQKLCQRLEKIASSIATTKDQSASGMDLATRLKLALAARTIGGSAAPQSDLQIQSAREEAARLKEKWQRLGPVLGERARSLAERVAHALSQIQSGNDEREFC